ncbi:MAG TPA: Rho termination factor N-terminal domain-containing protein, partial [Treponemataceae bacterium]|nr:Rho termination factor N-terminal domain-containing protein [Treponemataceae bacterium]
MGGLPNSGGEQGPGGEPGEKRIIVRSRARRSGGQGGGNRDGSPREFREGRDNRDRNGGGDRDNNRRFRENREGRESRENREDQNYLREAAQAQAESEQAGDSGNKPRLTINELTRMGMHALRELATQYGVPHEDMVAMKKQEVIFQVLKAHTEHGGIIFASGSLEILPDGYGFLRSPQNSYLPGPDDIYISPSQIRLFNLKTGDTVYGQ